MKKGLLALSLVVAALSGAAAAVPYILRLDPATLEREVVRIEGEGMYPPPNSWYAWTPDPFCASAQTDCLYWCGGNNSWFTNYRVFRFDTRTRKIEKILDFSQEEGDWHVYGCSLGIHPRTDELYASMFHKFVDPTYVTRRYDADGNLLREYQMISNYWFPSLFVFPTPTEPGASLELPNVAEAPLGDIYTLGGVAVRRGVSADDTRGLSPGIYIWASGSERRKVAVR